MRERNRLLRDQASNAGWYAALKSRMGTAGTQITTNRRTALTRIAATTAGAQTTFPAPDLALTMPDNAPAPNNTNGLRAAFAERRRRDMAAGRTLAGPHRADLAAVYSTKGVPTAQASTGEQKALLISIVLANARALAENINTAPILLLNKVAAHLDAAHHAALYAKLLALHAQA